MKNVRWIGLVIAVLVIVVAGCCKDPKEYHYQISDEVLALSPYRSNSVFLLRHTDGHVARVVAISENRIDVQAATCSSCCATEYKDEYVIYFQSDSADIQATINISQTGTEGEFAPARLGVTLNNSGVFYADFQADGLCRAQDGMGCIDSLRVADRTYFDVFEFRNHSSNHAPNRPEKLYFNASDGILKVTEYGGTYWELVH